MSCEGWRLITDCCKNKDITYSPEFLRAKHWQTDSVLSDKIYLGGKSTQFWSDIFITALGKISIELGEPTELIAAKQLRNSYLALKVTFFNQVKDFCEAQDLDFQEVRKVITDDARIGASRPMLQTKEDTEDIVSPKMFQAPRFAR